MKLDLFPIERAPVEFKDGRQCLACDFLGKWRVVRFERDEGWVYYNSGDEPFSEYPYRTETMRPTHIAAIPDIGDLEADDVDA